MEESFPEELDNELDEIEPVGDEAQLYEHFRVVVDKGQSMVRVDKYLFERIVNASRNRIQKAAEDGFVMANGKPVKSSYKVKPLDVITVMMDRPRYENEIIPEDIPLDIVYEDSYVMVVNKPAGLVVHPGHGNYHGTLVNALAWHMKDVPDYDANDPHVGLVHRIDKDTSGLLVIAKTPDAKTNLGIQFYNKTTQRKYRALVWAMWSRTKEPSPVILPATRKTGCRWPSCPILSKESMLLLITVYWKDSDMLLWWNVCLKPDVPIKSVSI